jgi:hypothetical protein
MDDCRGRVSNWMVGNKHAASDSNIPEEEDFSCTVSKALKLT